MSSNSRDLCVGKVRKFVLQDFDDDNCMKLSSK